MCESNVKINKEKLNFDVDNEALQHPLHIQLQVISSSVIEFHALNGRIHLHLCMIPFNYIIRVRHGIPTQCVCHFQFALYRDTRLHRRSRQKIHHVLK